MPADSLTIGIDALAWQNPRGYGRYLREIVGGLLAVPSPHRFRLIVGAGTDAGALPRSSAIDIVRIEASPANASGLRSVRAMLATSRAWGDRAVDVALFPSPLTFVPSIRARPTVLVLHDTIGHRLSPLVFNRRVDAWAWRTKVALGLRQATRLVAVSEHARQTVVSDLGVAAGRITVVPEAPARAFCVPRDETAIHALRASLLIPPNARVVAYHGALARHKNVVALIEAAHRLARVQHAPPLVLVLAGRAASDRDEQWHRAAAAAGPARVVFAGALPDAAMVSLLHTASAAVLPSLDEGFGLTGLEAAAAGTPLVATRASAMPEVLGDGALYIDPRRRGDLDAALGEVLDDPGAAATRAARAMTRARALTWPDAARTLLDVLVAAAGDRSARG